MDDLTWYATQSPYTDPGTYAERLDGVPPDIAGITGRCVRPLMP